MCAASLSLYAFHVILWKRALWQREPLHGFSHGERAGASGLDLFLDLYYNAPIVSGCAALSAELQNSTKTTRWRSVYVGVSASWCPERRGAGDARAIESTFSRLRSNFRRASEGSSAWVS